MSSLTKTLALHRTVSSEPCTAMKQTGMFEIAACSHAAGFHSSHQWLDDETGEILVEWPNTALAEVVVDSDRRAA